MYLADRYIGYAWPHSRKLEHLCITPIEVSLQTPDPSKEADVVLRLLEKERTFELGTRVELSPYDLHELCFFYCLLVERVVKHLRDYLARLGVGEAEATMTPA